MAGLLGIFVGLALGLTGGGGSILAVPLLIHGLHMPVHEAIGVSLATVGSTALFGALIRIPRGEVDFQAGLVFAIAGMVGAPAGVWMGGGIPAHLLLTGFAILMIVVAVHMWRHRPPPHETHGANPLTRFLARTGTGLGIGVMSGLFGVGGGFLIVPALVLLERLDIRRAMGTSLLVIALLSASGVTSLIIAHRPLPLGTSLLFIAGSIGGLLAGTLVGRRLPHTALRRAFAVLIIAVAILMLILPTPRHAPPASAKTAELEQAVVGGHSVIVPKRQAGTRRQFTYSFEIANPTRWIA